MAECLRCRTGGRGAGLSASAGFVYSGPRFEEHFADFQAKYGFRDMYSGGFYPYPTLEEFWAFWSRNSLINRYTDPPKPVYEDLLRLVEDKDYFVLTTNVDSLLPKAGFDKNGCSTPKETTGLWQCSGPCHRTTYDNESAVRRMVAEQRSMRIPTKCIPYCPNAAGP